MNENEAPVGVLKAEHQLILRVIRVLEGLVDRYERNGDFRPEPLGRCVTFIRNFADACHHGKEEDLLFPVLEDRGIPREGGPIGVMIAEHQLARGYTKDMAAALSAVQAGDEAARSQFVQAAKQYIELLTNHIFKEDNILFQLGDQVMSPEDQTSLAERFCTVNCKLFDGRRREELEQLAHDLETEWKDLPERA